MFNNLNVKKKIHCKQLETILFALLQNYYFVGDSSVWEYNKEY